MGIFFRYRIRYLKNLQEYSEYNRRYVNNGGDQSIDISWMRSSKVIGVFAGNDLVAGFVESSPPTRSVADIPDQIRHQLLESECQSLANVQENAAFWISRSVQGKRSLQAFVWAAIVFRSVFCTRCKYTLGASNRLSITKLYQFFCGNTIYEAPSKLNPGERYHVFIWSKTQLLTVGFQIVRRLLERSTSKATETNATTELPSV
ncbi:hypothetical protein [Pseudobacteriovorax antillogorgiicola]|uniref:Uncharacterized protein n=1 Tax=Pseudobacteriovorax antillogorgiicola TaxID=1513793 RepID=A0A1Y6BHT5_9BACT|nr:hypothetical protein [Pseudobacteriovorax antillogorgiicola]TCS55558.1 hypothetical protein EDD56_105284 [Pseudobacteriovorax antillogorgiicola]SMF10995.1 hypothetical protein SAMN06296036_10540 [Pseudobacteriovorax antillogorgiicola]